MSYCLLTGEIYFTVILSYEEITDISYFLLEKAIINRIGLNMNYNLTKLGFCRYPLRDYLKTDGYIPYEILDDPLSNDCHKIFEGIWYIDKTYKIACVNQSRLPNIQNFFEDIIWHEKISHIIFELQGVHSYGLKKFSEYQIRANQFCKTIIDAPNEESTDGMPTIRLNIIK